MAAQFGVLNRNFGELNAYIERLEARSLYREDKAIKMSMALLTWNRLFFFSISQTSSSLECTDWWVVLALSLSCTFLYLLFFMRAVMMLYWTLNQLGIFCEERTEILRKILEARSQNDAVSMEAGGSSDGFEFSFDFQVRALNYDSFGIVETKVYVCTIVCAMLAVAAFELFACKYLLCN